MHPCASPPGLVRCSPLTPSQGLSSPELLCRWRGALIGVPMNRVGAVEAEPIEPARGGACRGDSDDWRRVTCGGRDVAGDPPPSPNLQGYHKSCPRASRTHWSHRNCTALDAFGIGRCVRGRWRGRSPWRYGGLLPGGGGRGEYADTAGRRGERGAETAAPAERCRGAGQDSPPNAKSARPESNSNLLTGSGPIDWTMVSVGLLDDDISRYLWLCRLPAIPKYDRPPSPNVLSSQGADPHRRPRP